MRIQKTLQIWICCALHKISAHFSCSEFFVIQIRKFRVCVIDDHLNDKTIGILLLYLLVCARARLLCIGNVFRFVWYARTTRETAQNACAHSIHGMRRDAKVFGNDWKSMLNSIRNETDTFSGRILMAVVAQPWVRASVAAFFSCVFPLRPHSVDRIQWIWNTNWKSRKNSSDLNIFIWPFGRFVAVHNRFGTAGGRGRQSVDIVNIFIAFELCWFDHDHFALFDEVFVNDSVLFSRFSIFRSGFLVIYQFSGLFKWHPYV